METDVMRLNTALTNHIATINEALDFSLPEKRLVKIAVWLLADQAAKDAKTLEQWIGCALASGEV